MSALTDEEARAILEHTAKMLSASDRFFFLAVNEGDHIHAVSSADSDGKFGQLDCVGIEIIDGCIQLNFSGWK